MFRGAPKTRPGHRRSAGCLTGFGSTTWCLVDGLRTGITAGKHGARYLRADGDVFYYVSLTIFGVGSVFWLGLAAFAILVLVRWNDWT